MIALAALVACAGCSLLGLDRYVEPPCTSDHDCDELNQIEGIDTTTACELYQCVEASGACVRGVRDGDDDGVAPPSCGGEDCDDTFPGGVLGAALTVVPIVEGVPRPAWLRWGVGPNTVAAAYGAGAGGAFDLLEAPAPRSATRVGFAMDDFARATFASPDILLDCPYATIVPQVPPDTPVIDPGPCTTHAECQDGDFCNGWETCDPASTQSDARGCRAAAIALCVAAGEICAPSARACLRVAPGTCSVDELVAAHVRDDEWMGVAIDATCPEGLVRVGWLSNAAIDVADGAPGPNLLARGGVERAPAFYGIDLDASGCTGGSRAVGAARGASSLALAVLPSSASRGRYRPTGLAAWLATPQCEPGACASGPFTVEVLGLWHEEMLNLTPDGHPVSWITPANDGRPQELASRARVIAPPAIAAMDWGDRAGFAVAYSAEGGGIAIRFVPALPTPPEVAVGETYVTIVGTAPRTTAPLELGFAQTIDGSATGVLVDRVAVAAHLRSLRLAWIEAGALYTAAFELDVTAATLTPIGAPERIASGADSPELVFAEGLCGFECDGFALTWIEAGRARLLRLRFDGRHFDAEPFELGESVLAPRPFISGDGLAVAWHEGAQDAIVRTSAACP